MRTHCSTVVKYINNTQSTTENASKFGERLNLLNGQANELGELRTVHHYVQYSQ